MGLFDALLDVVKEEIAQSVVVEAFTEAVSLMEGMPANEGQESVYLNHVIPAFEETFFSLAPLAGEVQWEPVDIGEYMDFMGEIVEAGNQVMEEAFAYAEEIKDSLASAAAAQNDLSEFAMEAAELAEELDSEFEDIT